jgi:hypothetical protein
MKWIGRWFIFITETLGEYGLKTLIRIPQGSKFVGADYFCTVNRTIFT